MAEETPLSHILPVLRDLTAWLAAEGVSGALIGGVAASFQSRPRFTRDVDAVIVLEEEKWAAFLKAGVPFGFVPRIPDAVAFASRSRVLLACHASTRINVDLMLAGIPFERAVVARAAPVDIAGLRLPLPTPEDLVVLKAIAGRPRDLDDIAAILEAHPNLDTRRIRRIVRGLATALESPDLADNLRRLLARRPKGKR